MAVIGFPQILMWLLNFILCSHRKKTEFPYIYGYVCFCEMNIYCISDLKHDKLYDVKMLYNLHSTRRKGKTLTQHTFLPFLLGFSENWKKKLERRKSYFKYQKTQQYVPYHFGVFFQLNEDHLPWKTLLWENMFVCTTV